MTEPMSDARRAEIRAMSDDHRQHAGQRPGPTWGTGACCSAGPVAATVPELLAENEQLRTALKTVKIRSIQRELQTLAHTALYGTKQKGSDRG